MSTSTQCLDCKYYNSFSTCDAFLDGIPQEIFDGRVIHDVPYGGDGGIMYDPIDPELSQDQMVSVIKILDDEGLLSKFEIPDELLEAVDIDPKKMSPEALKAMFAALKEKGLLKDKPADKKSADKKPGAKEPEAAEGSRPGLVKKKVTVRRNGKSSEEYRWVKAGEDEPAEKPKKGEEDTGEVPGESTGKSVEPEKPKGPVIMGLNKPESDSDDKDKEKK
jgi:hypothetical protein